MSAVLPSRLLPITPSSFGGRKPQRGSLSCRGDGKSTFLEDDSGLLSFTRITANHFERQTWSWKKNNHHNNGPHLGNSAPCLCCLLWNCTYRHLYPAPNLHSVFPTQTSAIGPLSRSWWEVCPVAQKTSQVQTSVHPALFLLMTSPWHTATQFIIRFY